MGTKMYHAHIFDKSGSIYVKPKRQSDQRPILHLSSNTFHQRKCFVCCDVCNYLGGPRVSAAAWPCTYLFTAVRNVITHVLMVLWSVSSYYPSSNTYTSSKSAWQNILLLHILIIC